MGALHNRLKLELVEIMILLIPKIMRNRGKDQELYQHGPKAQMKNELKFHLGPALKFFCQCLSIFIEEEEASFSRLSPVRAQFLQQ
jgi:hypothetical protein